MEQNKIGLYIQRWIFVIIDCEAMHSKILAAWTSRE